MSFEAILVAVLLWFLVSVLLGLFVGRFIRLGSGSSGEWAGEDEEQRAA